MKEGLYAYKGLKIGDIDPRGVIEYAFTISDKARGSWWRSFRGGDTIFEKGKENRIWPIDLYLKKVLEELEKGKELAIATIINAKGSTPGILELRWWF